MSEEWNIAALWREMQCGKGLHEWVFKRFSSIGRCKHCGETIQT